MPRFTQSLLLGAAVGLMLWVVYRFIDHVCTRYIKRWIDHDFENMVSWLESDLHYPDHMLGFVGLGHITGRAEWVMAATLGAVLGTAHYLHVRKRRR